MNTLGPFTSKYSRTPFPTLFALREQAKQGPQRLADLNFLDKWLYRELTQQTGSPGAIVGYQ
jgi:hypothetical protein